MVDVKDKVAEGHIHFVSIIEMMGAPKEHLDKSLKSYVDKLKQSKDLTVIKATFAKPKKPKDQELWSMFVELDMLAKNASAIAFYCFDYMPSSIEIVEPDKFIYTSKGFSDFFNDMQARLHRVDMLLKNATAENKNLLRNANLFLRNLILIALEKQDRTLEELSKKTGIQPQQLENFVEAMVQEKWLKFEKGKYTRKRKK
jgi:hypothetical protein